MEIIATMRIESRAPVKEGGREDGAPVKLQAEGMAHAKQGQKQHSFQEYSKPEEELNDK